MRKAKILATLGPATNSQEMIEKMLDAGMNAVRINMSHGTREEHTATIAAARAAAAKLEKPLAVLVDLAGPKIRTRGLIDGKPVELIAGQQFTITTEDVPGSRERVATNYGELPLAVEPGARILIDDGAIELVVESETDTEIVTSVVTGGILLERKGINLPNTSLPIPSLTDKDREDLEWAIEQNVDYIALSFVRTADDCKEVKELIKKLNKRPMGRALLVAKIEKAEAVENLVGIIEETDGLMVARGDLGVETSVELVPVYQKRIIELAIAHDKFVITATQMLQSMIANPFPTRAEASDVANAVWDGTDAVMLSAETATGKYPVETIGTMVKIIESAETIKGDQLKRPVKLSQEPSGRTSQALCKAAVYAAEEMNTSKVAVFTESGLMARRLSSFRSGLHTFALTASESVRDQLSLIWGVKPFCHKDLHSAVEAEELGDTTMYDLLKVDTTVGSTEQMLRTGERMLLEAETVSAGETMVMMAGRLSGHGLSSSVIVWTIGAKVPNK